MVNPSPILEKDKSGHSPHAKLLRELRLLISGKEHKPGMMRMFRRRFLERAFDT